HDVVIDDDDIMLLSCRRILEKAGYQVETFSNGLDGIRRIRELRPELLLVDLKMPELDGLQVIERVRAVDPDVVIAVITGYATISTAVDAMKAGAYDFLPKPFTPDELRLIVNRGHERWRLAMESQRLRREKEEAERRFLTFVSHQLKSPLVAAKQYLDVLLFTSKGEMTPRTEEWLSRAQARLSEMLSLIHDWLALARIGRGTPSEPGAMTDLCAVIGETVEAASPQARTAGVTITTGLGPGIGAVAGDRVSLDTVVANLMGNAIKYNRVGGTVTVRAARDGDTVVLEVADTGIGIAEDSLPALFGEFYRVKTDRTRDIPGTGLGLAICRRIVTDLGGSIEVHSRVDEGTTFAVRLPASTPADRPDERPGVIPA
ncbi:MAG: hybrid sensor histidine kinase/response regulator, partial [Acidobacteria bacterium]|nr:hybrid sensor histidine kinase/response regulator [Acidobacteriota bacterium]